MMVVVEVEWGTSGYVHDEKHQQQHPRPSFTARLPIANTPAGGADGGDTL